MIWIENDEILPEHQANEFVILFELEAQKLKELLHDYRNYLLGIQQLSVM